MLQKEKQTSKRIFQEHKLIFMAGSQSQEDQSNIASQSIDSQQQSTEHISESDAERARQNAQLSTKKETRKEITKTQLESLKSYSFEGVDAKAVLYDQAEISKERREHSISADNWGLTSKEAYKRVESDWKKLGLLDSSGNSFEKPYYAKAIYSELVKLSNPDFMGNLSDLERQLLSPPYTDDNLTRLQDEFPKHASLARALEIYNAVRFSVMSQDNNFEQGQAAMEDEDKVGIVEWGKDFARDQFKHMKKTWRTGDTVDKLAMVGMYAGAIWGLYKTFRYFFPKGKETIWGKLILPVGLAMFCGNEVLKAGGIDVMKEVDFEDNLAEVKGTFLESIGGIKGLDRADQIDGQTYLATKDIPLHRLHGAYVESNNGQIDPYYFNQYDGFKEFKKPLEISKDERQKEVAKSLYLIAHNLNRAYDVTMKQDPGDQENNIENPYHNLSYDQALKGPLAGANVNDLSAQLKEYAVKRPHESWASFATTNEEAQTQFDNVFSGSGMAVRLEYEPLKNDLQGTIAGTIMGLGVAIIPYYESEDTKVYRVYAMSDFKKNIGTPPPSMLLGTVPGEGTSQTAVDKLKKNIPDKVKELSQMGTINGKDVLSNYQYIGGRWQAEYSSPEISGFGIPSKTDTVFIDINERGAVKYTSKSTGESWELNQNKQERAQSSIENLVMTDVFQDPDLSALQVLSRAGKIDNIKLNESSGTIELSLLGKKLNILHNKNAADKKDRFDIANATEEKELINHPEFIAVISSSAPEDQRISSAFEEFRNAVAGAPEDVFYDYLKRFPGNAWDIITGNPHIDSASGSVPDNFSNTLLAIKKDFIEHNLFSRIQNLSDSQKDLRNIGKMTEILVSDVATEVKKTADYLNEANAKYAENTDGFWNTVYNNVAGEDDDWSRSEFETKVLSNIYGAGSSKVYSDQLQGFINYISAEYDEFKGSDYSESGHSKLRKIADVFLFYTAGLDKPGLKGDSDEGKALVEKCQKVKSAIVAKIESDESTFLNIVPDPEAWALY